MKTKADILNIAKNQLALDYNFQISDFNRSGNIVVENKLLSGRRIYESDGCFFKVVCFGGKAIISTSKEMMPWCEENLGNRQAAWFFQCSNLKRIEKKLQEFGHEIENIHHYYLPRPDIPAASARTDIRWYEKEDILQFQGDDRFDEAFAFNENYPDVLGVAALSGNTIIGMAGASADSKELWQIGINVMPQCRGNGTGTNLVMLLKDEILKRGKVPFYGTVESHIYSQNVAINSGFFPAWAELHSTVKAKK